jgi:PAS domain S-box-containing protein
VAQAIPRLRSSVNQRAKLFISSRQPRFKVYLLALVVTGVVTALRLSLASWFGDRPVLILFVLPIFLSSYVGGLGPGLVATGVAALGTSYLLIPPLASFAIASSVDTWDWLVLIVVGVLISTLTEARLQEIQRQEASARRRGDLLPERKVQVGFALALACLGVVGVISFTSVTRLCEEVDQTRHTEEVIAALRLLLSSATDVESAQRGYAITGNASFLEPYAEARHRISSELDELHRLTADNITQQRRLGRLAPLLAARIDEAAENVELRRNRGFAAAEEAIATGRGKILHDRVRAAVAEMEATERALLSARASTARHSVTLAHAVISGGNALAFGCVAVALLMIGRDFAGGRRAEAALRKANEQLEARVQERTSALERSEACLAGIVGSAMDAIISVNREQRIILFNAAAEKLFGCAASEALGQALDRFIPVRFREHHRQHVAGFGSTDVTSRSMRSPSVLSAVGADGVEFPIEASISQVDVAGERLFTVVLRDITARKRAEEASALLAALVESSSDAIVSKDLQSRVTSWNAGAETMFGYTANEIVGQSITVLIPPESQADESRILEQVRRGERVEHFETTRVKKNGSLIHVSVTVSPIRDLGGRIVGASKVARDVSERKRAEAALNESQEALRLMLDAANIGYWNLDLLTHAANHSPQHDQIFGYSELLPEWTVETFLKHVLPEDSERVQRLFLAGVAAKTQLDFECRIIRHDGALRWIWVHGNVFCNAAGEPVRMLGMVSDITNRKSAEARAVWLASFPERNPSPILEIEPASGVVYYLNPAALQQFPDLEVEGLKHPLLAGLPAVAAELAEKGTIHRELTVGNSFFSQLLTYIADLRRVRIYSTDVTKRRNAEEALREREAELHAADRRLADIVQGMTEGCFALDSAWRFNFVNDRAATLLQREREQMLGRTIWEIFPVLAGTAFEDNYRHAMNERTPLAFEVYSTIAERWLDIRLFPSGEGLAAFLLDVHDRKTAELEREKFVSLAENSLEFIGMRNLQGVPVFVNDAALKMVGLDSLEQALKTTPADFFFPEDQAFIRDEFVPRVHRDGHAEAEIRFRHFKTGEAIWMIYNAFVVRDSNGTPTVHATVSRNITDRKLAEQEVQQLNASLERRVAERTDQLEAANKELEAFSYSVSHDLRAPLRAVSGFSQIVLEDFGPQLPEEGKRYLQTICDGAQRMGILIDDLLGFARLSRLPLTKRTVDTQQLVSETLAELNADPAGRKLEIRLAELPPCEADPALLKQVWVNLLSNAFKYTSQREHAIVEIGATREKGAVVYFVRDNGTGFDMQYAAKLFGVFQRLHRQEEFAGTGVGLAIAQRIVGRHSGRIWADAAVDRGATFYFTLSGDSE